MTRHGKRSRNKVFTYMNVIHYDYWHAVFSWWHQNLLDVLDLQVEHNDYQHGAMWQLQQMVSLVINNKQWNHTIGMFRLCVNLEKQPEGDWNCPKCNTKKKRNSWLDPLFLLTSRMFETFVGRAFASSFWLLVIQYNSVDLKQTEVEAAWNCEDSELPTWTRTIHYTLMDRDD